MEREKEFRKRLLATFKAEAMEHVVTMGACLTELERMPPIEVQMEVVETIFREAHSLKGAARAVNLAEVESVCQALESIFAQWKVRRVNQSRELFDTLYLAVDTVRSAISAGPEEHGVPAEQLSSLVAELERLSAGGSPVASFDAKFDPRTIEEPREPGPAMTAEAPPAAPTSAAVDEAPSSPVRERLRDPSGTVRIPAERLGSLLAEAEEMLPFKSEASIQSERISELLAMAEGLRAELAGAGRLSAPPGLKELLVKAQKRAHSLEASARALSKSARRHSWELGRMIDGLLEDTKKTMLLPFSSVMEAFPMLVRDISRKRGKEAELVSTGESLEIDRRILEEIKDPLIHLVRNCVDHGIERPSEREAAGKPRKGRITVSAAHADGNTAEIKVVDDGSGIDVGRVKAAAVKNDIISPEAASSIGPEEALSLIFFSGLSTSPIITEISGRGLGLAIVREKVEGLGGSVTVSSSKAGTSFSMLLPLTVATFRGILVGAGNQSFIVPTSGVERTLRVRKDQLGMAENRETVTIGGEPYSFVWLAPVLGLPARVEAGGSIQVLVLSAGGKKIVFGVDEVFGEEDVLVKGLGPQLRKVRNISGAAVLGTGKPVPILNVPDLLRSAVKSGGGAVIAAQPPRAAKKRSVLVAEDSITSRMLLKNILETAGYDVMTAIDGVEAWTLMKTEKFDILVSDVEMPRMSGFELTSRVRADRELSELPVVLVTALETREDRERGIEAGANAYMIKSSFNQNNLIEIIKRLTA
ncbi:two-component system, chemotaxis family, sensor kinase CheA [uncultured bacterium]|nr:two-component system, chemotaxis family, sensor kinase CheA [uncultured bacterium]